MAAAAMERPWRHVTDPMVVTHGGSDDDRIVKAGKSQPSKVARQRAPSDNEPGLVSCL